MKRLCSFLLFVAFIVTASAQVQNVQAGSGATGDITKPSTGLGLPSGYTLTAKAGSTIDAGSATSLIIPNGASPTTTAFGWLAADNNAWATGHGALQYNDGTANVYVPAVLASSTPSNGYVPTWQTGGTIIWAAAGGGSGTVTSASVVTANGFSGSVATATTTPAITLSIAGSLTLPAGSRQTFAPNTTTPGFNAGAVSGDPSTLSNGDLWYDSTGNNLRARINGASVSLGAAGGGSVANPTGTIGLTAVNGAASSAIRSDGAPALSQAIVPTWTGVHTFTPQVVLTGGASFPSGGTITGSSGAVTIAASNTNANINADPIGTGIFSVSKDPVFTDSASSRAFVGPSAGGTGLFVQRSGNAYTYNLSASASANVAIMMANAGGSLTALSATPTGRPYTLGFWSYGGSTWVDAAYIQAITTQLHSESARGTKISIITTPNNLTAGAVALVIDQDQSVKAFSPTGGLGYGTGAGGAVTQITSRTTGVTLSKVTGAITLVSAAGSTTPATFTVTNTTVAANDVVIVTQQSGTDLYEIHVTNTAAGSFKISCWTTGGTTTEQPVFNFAVIKAVNS